LDESDIVVCNCGTSTGGGGDNETGVVAASAMWRNIVFVFAVRFL